MHAIHVQLAEYVERKPASVEEERCDDVTPLTPYEVALFLLWSYEWSIHPTLKLDKIIAKLHKVKEDGSVNTISDYL
jgi:hypothetical protein